MALGRSSRQGGLDAAGVDGRRGEGGRPGTGGRTGVGGGHGADVGPANGAGHRKHHQRARTLLPELLSFTLAGLMLGGGLILAMRYMGDDARARVLAQPDWVALAAPVSRLTEKGDPLVPIRRLTEATEVRAARVARAHKGDALEHPLLTPARAATPPPAPRVMLASIDPLEGIAAVARAARAGNDNGEQARQAPSPVADALLRTPPVWKLERSWKLARSERLRILRARKKRLREKICLAKAIYFEARSESTAGQMAVAKVVLNRVRDPRFPSTICGVVYQGAEYRNACQFSFACDGKPDYPTEQRHWQIAKRLAAKAMRGEIRMKALEGVAFYHADYVQPRWAGAMRRVVKIGRHIFYRDS